MSIYYSDEFVTLYHTDAREVREWTTASVLVTDPPYGIGYASGWDSATLARSIANDNDTSARDGALRMWGDRPALVFGTWRAPRPTDTRMVLIWDTLGALGMGDLSLPWKPAHQEVYVLGTGFVGRRDSDVLQCPPVQSMAKNGRLHPHEKPVDLMRRLIAKCPPGTVADPFCGSGSTLVAAKLEGRKAIGVEVDERHCETAANRLSQGVLFGMEVPA